MATLRIGARGSDVAQFKAALSERLTPSPRLSGDLYDVNTWTAVKRFQRENWLVEDGEAGDGTQAAVFGSEAFTPILHASTPFIPQPDEDTCWAASTAMITNSTVAEVQRRTPNALILPGTGQIDNYSWESQTSKPAELFASSNGIRLVADQVTWTPRMLQNGLQRGPLMIAMLWRPDQYARGVGSPGHMVVIVGIRGDGDPSGRGTTLRIQDPWPPRAGARYSVGYAKWIHEVPTRTYQTFQR